MNSISSPQTQIYILTTFLANYRWMMTTSDLCLMTSTAAVLRARHTRFQSVRRSFGGTPQSHYP